MGQLRDREGWAGGSDGARVNSENSDRPQLIPFPNGGLTQERDELLQEVLQDQMEWEQELDEVKRRLQRRLDLLAWVLRQAHDPSPIQALENWPDGLWLFDWPDTWELVRVDPIFHDLARWQIVAARQGQMDDEADFDETFAGFDYTTDFLLAERPSSAGKTNGRWAVEHLVRAIFRELDSFPTLWEGVRHHKSTTDFGWGPVMTEDGPPSVLSVAVAIADRLSSHPTLQAHPEACLSADAIRPILRP
jgi:hypothetical protein